MQLPYIVRDLTTDLLGIPASAAQPALQVDCYKELVGKLAWAIGSSYHTPYSNNRCVARLCALDLARVIVTGHGYPRHIGYPD